MPTEYSFRLSTYITLGLSCLCLGYAEWGLLPEASILAALVIVSLIVSFRAEGRYVLSLTAANRVGLLIGLAGGAWLAYQFYRSTSLIYTLPWPASLLPYLGPLLMVLIPAKLFRPKHVGDWWAMQGIGLAAVGLASAMAEDEFFGLLLLLYALAGVYSVTLFYYRRSAGTLPPVPNTEPDPPTSVITQEARAPVARAVFWKSLRWLSLAGVVALPLFFITPRAQTSRWQFGNSIRETGFGADQVVDLNRTGELRVTRELAWEVRATHLDGRPMDDLNPSQRFRGIGYHTYEDGLWRRNTFGSLLVGTTVSNVPPPGTPLVEILPDLGPDAFYLSFLPRGRRLEPVIADPTRWHVNQPAPIASETSTGPRLWKQTTDASFRAPPTPRGGLVPYTQIVRPSNQPGDEDLGSPFEMFRPVSQARTDPMSLVYQYSEMKLPRLREFAVELLYRLARDNPELGATLDRVDRRRSFEIDPVDFERVGRAFNNYLSSSGEYIYSLTTRRIERNYDPIEDFLFISKEGSCERFATALVLLLRAVGVPAVYVLGFKGCEHEGNGVYAIRQDHAHAWVEILVPRPAPPGFPFARRVGSPAPTEVWHWLSLDPTPTGTTEGDSGTFENWLGSARETWATFFLDFIVGYNTDRRQRTVGAIQAWLAEWWWSLLAVPLFGLTAWGGRQAIRWLRPTQSASENGNHTDYPWFDRLSAVLASCGLVRPPGWTPRELASRSSRSLQADPRTALVADIPLRVTLAFYRARYANRPPDAGEVKSLEEAVELLEKTVTSAGWTDLAEGGIL